MPYIVREWLRLCWFNRFPSNCLEGGNKTSFIDSPVDRSEALELAVRDSCCNNTVVFENICSSRRVHADFEAIIDEDIAGEEIRVHLRNMKYILQFHHSGIAVPIYDGDIDRSNTYSIQLSLCCLDLNRVFEMEISPI